MGRRRSQDGEANDEGFALFACDFIMCSLCATLLIAIIQQSLLADEILDKRSEIRSGLVAEQGNAPKVPDRNGGLVALYDPPESVRRFLLGKPGQSGTDPIGGLPPRLVTASWRTLDASGAEGLSSGLEAALRESAPHPPARVADLAVTDTLVVAPLAEAMPSNGQIAPTQSKLHWILQAPDPAAFQELKAAFAADPSGQSWPAALQKWKISLRPGDDAVVVPNAGNGAPIP
jgi:hypothetical protein